MSQREYVNEWEGFDGNIKGGYSEVKDKRYHAFIWWGLFLFFLGIFLSIAFNHFKEFVVVATYDRLEVDYADSKKSTVYYTDYKGEEHLLYLPGERIVTHNGKVVLFYKDKIDKVEYIISGYRWVRYYLFYGALTLVCGSRLYLIYFRKKHAVEKQSNT